MTLLNIMVLIVIFLIRSLIRRKYAGCFSALFLCEELFKKENVDNSFVYRPTMRGSGVHRNGTGGPHLHVSIAVGVTLVRLLK